eukprot:6189504-Pleurochrysis_carterae.AAC.4
MHAQLRSDNVVLDGDQGARLRTQRLPLQPQCALAPERAQPPLPPKQARACVPTASCSLQRADCAVPHARLPPRDAAATDTLHACGRALLALAFLLEPRRLNVFRKRGESSRTRRTRGERTLQTVPPLAIRLLFHFPDAHAPQRPPARHPATPPPRTLKPPRGVMLREAPSSLLQLRVSQCLQLSHSPHPARSALQAQAGVLPLLQFAQEPTAPRTHPHKGL